MRFYTPEKLNLEAIIPGLKLDDYDKLNYLIHLIYEQKALYKIQSEYVPLKALYLRKILRDHKFYRELLEKHEIIECDYKYVKNSKSFGLRLTDNYQGSYRKVDCRCNKIALRIKKLRDENKSNTPVHQFLEKQLRKIEIDALAAREYIQDWDDEKRISADILIDKIQNQDWYFLCDEFGRVHTNLTILKSSLRRFLKVNNQELVNVDISNSQPLFLFLLILSSNNSYYNTIRCAVSPNPLEELNLYGEIVQSGKLYEFMSDYYQETDRKLVKEFFFKDMFGPTISLSFRQAFPVIAHYLASIKKRDYRRVAWMMQREESKMIISCICGRLMKINPDAFISTIHDSIFTTPDYVATIQKVIFEEFHRFGITPALKVENYAV